MSVLKYGVCCLFDGSGKKAPNYEGFVNLEAICLLGTTGCFIFGMACFSVGLEMISRIFLDLH